MNRWKIALDRFWQWTWGLPQTLVGLAMAIKYRRCPRKRVGGAVATLHDGDWGGVSLGMFIFVPGGLGPEREARLLAHEYGHTIQSLFFGPSYLLTVGLPSILWAGLPRFKKLRREGRRNYYSVYPEKQATRLGKRYAKKSVPRM